MAAKTKKIVANSSFNKINQSLMLFSEWKALNLKFQEIVSGANITGYTFIRQHNYNSGKDEIVARYTLQFGLMGEIIRSNIGPEFIIPTGDIFGEEFTNPMVRQNFGGRKCPTYNCKLDNFLKQWPEFVRAKLVELNKDLVVECETRIKEQFQVMKNSEDLVRDKQTFFETGVIEEIRAVVQKYYGVVTPDILKQALDAVVCHSVTES